MRFCSWQSESPSNIIFDVKSECLSTVNELKHEPLLVTYLHLISQAAPQNMAVRVGCSTCRNECDVLLSPQNSAGTIPPQSGHTVDKRNKVTVS